jgi:hypothetical protein
MWEPRRLITLRVFTACYRDSFNYFFLQKLVSFRALMDFSRFSHLFFVAYLTSVVVSNLHEIEDLRKETITAHQIKSELYICNCMSKE